MDSGDTAWLLVSTAMVMLMVPGVGLFYAGMVRRKNAVSMLSLSFVALAVVSLQWVLLGYTLSFSSDVLGFVGDLSWLGLRGVSGDSGSIPSLLFVAFQLTFAAVTLAILSSGVAERVKLSSFMVFGLLWTTLVYDPLAHWVWGGGWLAKLGALDFAGGTVVHISSGFSALALAFVVGKRLGYEEHSITPHNIPMTMLGTALLWFGWFGFNAGSALSAGESAANALLVTNTAAASGAIAWLIASWLHDKPSALGMVSGAIAGLVAITPAAGYVDSISAMAIGGLAGALCYGAMLFRVRMRWDESLDAWAVHGIGGVWGALATGIFAMESVGGYSGLLYGNTDQFVAQVIATASAILYAFAVTLVLAKAVDMAMGLRVAQEEEYVGLDISQHGERAYA
ncbi:ammonium transporter [Geoglobus ahangari]|uniref:Ammonium transporter n=1 Tax=Geoglobus ahangari TaxID=113653 RepID=A0A0F7IH39_9EURY|nr:ammonium transporter [Geoglobus ahangari]